MDMKWLLYTFLGVIADALDTVLTSVTPVRRSRRSIAPSDVDHLSDEEIIKLWENAPQLDPLDRFDYLKKLTPNTIAKISQDMDYDVQDATEANVLDLLFAKTTIPVPRVRRVVNMSSTLIIIMDYIPGPTLAQAWPALSIWRKVQVAFTLRRYIRQLRRQKASAMTPPGPLSPHGPRICESPVFGRIRSTRGPFASYSELSTFFNERQKMTADMANKPQDDPSRNEHFDDSEPLVLTHQDINLRNIIVGDDSSLYLIDWAWSGFYPVWFELIAMTRQNSHEKMSGTDDPLWETFIPFICGPHFRQARWLDQMAASLNYI